MTSPHTHRNTQRSINTSTESEQKRQTTRFRRDDISVNDTGRSDTSTQDKITLSEVLGYHDTETPVEQQISTEDIRGCKSDIIQPPKCVLLAAGEQKMQLADGTHGPHVFDVALWVKKEQNIKLPYAGK